MADNSNTLNAFGLINAPSTFQRTIKYVFSEFSFVEVFLDDILIHSHDISIHKEHLIKVLERCKTLKITINFDKTNIYVDKVQCLEFSLSKKSYSANIPHNELPKLSVIPKSRR